MNVLVDVEAGNISDLIWSPFPHHLGMTETDEDCPLVPVLAQRVPAGSGELPGDTSSVYHGRDVELLHNNSMGTWRVKQKERDKVSLQNHITAVFMVLEQHS